MNAPFTAWLRGTFLSVLGCLVAACSPHDGPVTDSQTNWLRACESDADCGALQCLCGACTSGCSAETDCESLQEEGASCVTADEAGSVALCGGQTPPAPGVCLPRCDDEDCPSGQMCVAGACSPVPEPTTTVIVDSSVLHQRLIGFGATLAYAENEVLAHPRSGELFEAMSAGLGLDVLRLRNRYGYVGDDDLTTAGEILDSVAASLGRPPVVMLVSWSPPPEMKVSGALECRGNADTCTLAEAAGGGFDYAALGTYWRDSLDAYAQVGVAPDFIAIQNNPDFVPDANNPGEACRFLPVEGTATVSVNGTDVEVTYPGFSETLAAVVEQLGGLSSPPQIAAPETSYGQIAGRFLAELDIGQVDAISHHLYGFDPASLDVSSFETLAPLGESYARPLLQTEMHAGGLDTAVLAHYSLAVEGAAAYLHSILVGRADAANTESEGLIGIDAAGFELAPAYHAMRHYALYTDPEWTRTDALSDSEDLLASAWIAPDGDLLTLVMVNAAESELDVRVDLGDDATMSSEVIRTVFDGIERSAELGTLDGEGIVRLPGHSIVTVALQR